jgi:hypothetical protein
MLKGVKQWEVRLKVSVSRNRDYVDQAYAVSIYGETVDELQRNVRNYLIQHRPSYFANDGDHVTGLVMYACSDGIIPPPPDWKEINAFWDDDFKEQKGWWFYSRRLFEGRLRYDESHLCPFFVGSFEEALDNYFWRAFIPRKGPNYQSRAVMGKQLQLPLLESVLREAEEFTLNDLLLRGWQLLAVEYQGAVSKTGELTNRKASFVLGHADVCAAGYALEAQDPYYYRVYRWHSEEKAESSP